MLELDRAAYFAVCDVFAVVHRLMDLFEGVYDYPDDDEGNLGDEPDDSLWEACFLELDVTIAHAEKERETDPEGRPTILVERAYWKLVQAAYTALVANQARYFPNKTERHLPDYDVYNAIEDRREHIIEDLLRPLDASGPAQELIDAGRETWARSSGWARVLGDSFDASV